MKTKLVYVLTCSPEGNYIEQALMAMWSARYHNPDAHIVLLTDDQTSELLIGKRGELLEYVSERIIIGFEDERASMVYRSRWIKTQVREYVKGDFLFIDCDTICCKSLDAIDSFTFDIGAVGDDNVRFTHNVMKKETCEYVANLGCDISDEEFYFSSGVIYCKDRVVCHELYRLWHKYWKEGYENASIFADQPSLAKCNIELGRVIRPMDDVLNCVLFTQNSRLRDAVILHVSPSKFSSFLFSKRVLNIIKRTGITPWLASCILNVHSTYLPFDYHIKHSTPKQRRLWIREIAGAAKVYGNYVSRRYEDWQFAVGIAPLVKGLFFCRLYRMGAALWLMWKRRIVRKKDYLKSNICSTI